ncbi:hypothetical protein CC80DRAFT_595569 [Byssothecium circinans]|uniref:Uncharacterized protein n=1 Tax=Byssothecium circinans TaxID=147558 RepID=A0A6A5TQP6_9PLEO|nr:hypothetical protein CC80DRAFT_595569 [Byssothecium circinans]
MRYLFTSPSTPTTLALARVLSAEGHAICAAAEERIRGTAPARFSNADERFHRLTPTFGLVDLWKNVRDEVDTIIPFGELPQHVRECLEGKGANILGRRLFEDDHDFQDPVRGKVVNTPNTSPSAIKAPAAFQVHSRMCIAEIFSQYPSTMFSLQPAPFYDMDDEDTLVEEEPASSAEEYLVLSCATLDDEMVESVKALPISEKRPYRLIEVVKGGSQYEAHAYINAGNIRMLVVTTSRGSEDEFLAVASSQPLFDVLYRFTLRLVDTLKDENAGNSHSGLETKQKSTLTTHLTLTFSVKEEVRPNGDFVRKVTVLNCSNETHPSLALLASVPSLRSQLALAYTDTAALLDPLRLPTTNMPWGLYSLPSATHTIFEVEMSILEVRRRVTVSSSDSKHAEGERSPTLQSSSGSEIIPSRRRRSQRHHAFRPRMPPMRLQASEAAGDPNDITNGSESRNRPNSGTIIADQEQFLDGRVRSPINIQIPNLVRTFSHSKSTGSQSEPETRSSIASVGRRCGSHQVKGMDGEPFPLQRTPRVKKRYRKGKAPVRDPPADVHAVSLEAIERRRHMSQAYTKTDTNTMRRSSSVRGEASCTTQQATYQHRDITPLFCGRNAVIQREDLRAVLFQGPRSGRPGIVNGESLERHHSQKAQLEIARTPSCRSAVSGMTERDGDDYFGDSVGQIEDAPPPIPPRSHRRPQWAFPSTIRDVQSSTPGSYESLTEDRGELRMCQGETSSMETDKVDECDFFGDTIGPEVEVMGCEGPISISSRPSADGERLGTAPVSRRAYTARGRRSSTHTRWTTSETEGDSNGHPAPRRQPTIPPLRISHPRPTRSAHTTASKTNANVRPPLPVVHTPHSDSHRPNYSPPSNLKPPHNNLPLPATHTARHPNRWYVVLYHWFTQQPSNALPNGSGSTFATSLHHDIAPAHWLLYWLQGMGWTGLAIFYFVSLAKVEATLAFECYELKTQLRLQGQGNPPTGKTEAGNSHAWTPSSIDVPSNYLSSSGDDACILTPLARASVIGANFHVLFMMGIVCCGVAFMLQAACYRLFGPCMKRSGAYGTGTLVVRIAVQVASCVAGVGIVLGITWGIVGRER